MACPVAVFINRDAAGDVVFRCDSLKHNHKRPVHPFTYQNSAGEKKRSMRVPLERRYMHPDIKSKFVGWVQQGLTGEQLKHETLKLTTAWSRSIIKKYPYAESEEYKQLQLKRVRFLIVFMYIIFVSFRSVNIGMCFISISRLFL